MSLWLCAYSGEFNSVVYSVGRHILPAFWCSCVEVLPHGCRARKSAGTVFEEGTVAVMSHRFYYERAND